MNLLVVVVIGLGIAAFAQLLKVYELSSELKGGNDETATDKDNRMGGRGMMLFFIAFFAFCLWQTIKYAHLLLPEPASAEGAQIEWLMNFNFILITIPFVGVHIFLAYFAFKYRGQTGKIATFYSHNNKLEMIWTVVPAIVLTVIIILGLRLWNQVTAPATSESMVVQLYAKQFDWTARYSGADNVLGQSSYRMIEGANELGVDMNDKNSNDDVVVKGELHLPIGKSVVFKLNSRDVIHSAFMPHFRAQMNCVPGMTTEMRFVPTITTEQMRKKTNNPKFDYILLCNKICGATHFNMQMNIVVESQADFNKWLSEQQNLATALKPATANAPATEMKADSAKVAMK
jgi:cytochrome c oxidase subunit 2